MKTNEETPFTKVNTVLFLINVLVFVTMRFTGDPSDAQYMYEHGAMISDPEILNGEYWRMITSAFLHFNLQHILNNMIMLVFLGAYVERVYGSVRYGILYFLCAAFSGAFSYGINLISGTFVVSAGASGAVFGIMGAFLFVVIRYRGRYAGFTLRRYLLMIALSLYYGFSTAGVDNAAHVGGFLMGIVAGFILLPKNDIRGDKR